MNLGKENESIEFKTSTSELKEAVDDVLIDNGGTKIGLPDYDI